MNLNRSSSAFRRGKGEEKENTRTGKIPPPLPLSSVQRGKEKNADTWMDSLPVLAWPGEKVFCSLSGGADSLALLLLLRRNAPGISLEAVHFEHGLRGKDSWSDAAFCEEFCRERGIAFRCIRLDVPGRKRKGEGLEGAARRLRLEAWKEIVTDPGSSCVALGHHAGDRMENVFLRLFRGSNASGLTSLRPVQELYGIRFIRPLLRIQKGELEDYLRSEGITQWCHDVTNGENTIRRNFLRNQVIPEIAKHFPYAVSGILRSAEVLEEDARFLEALAADSFQKISGRHEIPVSFWLGLPSALRIRVFRLWLGECLGRSDYVPDSPLLRRFQEELEPHTEQETETRTLPLPAGKENSGRTQPQLLFRKGKVSFCRCHCAAGRPEEGTEEKEEQLEWDYRNQPELFFGPYRLEARISREVPGGQQKRRAISVCEVFDAGKLPHCLTVSPRRTGEQMIPFGAQSPKPLKKLFSDAKMGRFEKEMLPVIRAEDTPIWIPYVKRSSAAPLTPETEECVLLSIVKLEE